MRAIQRTRRPATPRQGERARPYQVRSKGMIPRHRLWRPKASPKWSRWMRVSLERHTQSGSFLTTLFMLEVSGKKTRVIPRALAARSGSATVPCMSISCGSARARPVRLEIPIRFPWARKSSPGLKRGGRSETSCAMNSKVYASAERTFPR